MVVVPHHPGALVIGIVIFGIAGLRARVQHQVVQEAGPGVSVRIKPGVRTPVADPGNKPAMEMHRGAVRAQVPSHDRRVDGNDMSGWKGICERDLDRGAFLRDDDAAKMLLRLRTPAKRYVRIVPPQCRETEVGVKSILKWLDI